MILLSLGEVRNKQSLLVPALKQNIEHWQLLQLNLFGYVGYYRILVLTVPLQLNFTVIIEVLFKLLIMMSSMKNTLTSLTGFNIMTFVLTETADKKRLLIVMSSDIIPFAFENRGR